MDDEQASEDAFLDALNANEYWGLYDTGYMSTGLKCAICGYQVELSDRDAAIGFLESNEQCDNPNLTTIQRIAHRAIEQVMDATDDWREIIESIEWRFFGAGRVQQ